MIRLLALGALLILLIGGSACTTPESSIPKSPALSPDIKADPEEARRELQRAMKPKLEAARYELQLYEEQLEVTKKEISSREEKASMATKTGAILTGPSKDLLFAKRDNLEEKVIQAKVKIRELETILKEQ